MTKKMLEILGNRQRVGVWMKKNMMRLAVAAMMTVGVMGIAEAGQGVLPENEPEHFINDKLDNNIPGNAMYAHNSKYLYLTDTTGNVLGKIEIGSSVVKDMYIGREDTRTVAVPNDKDNRHYIDSKHYVIKLDDATSDPSLVLQKGFDDEFAAGNQTNVTTINFTTTVDNTSSDLFTVSSKNGIINYNLNTNWVKNAYIGGVAAQVVDGTGDNVGKKVINVLHDGTLAVNTSNQLTVNIDNDTIYFDQTTGKLKANAGISGTDTTSKNKVVAEAGTSGNVVTTYKVYEKNGLAPNAAIGDVTEDDKIAEIVDTNTTYKFEEFKEKIGDIEMAGIKITDSENNAPTYIAGGANVSIQYNKANNLFTINADGVRPDPVIPEEAGEGIRIEGNKIHANVDNKTIVINDNQITLGKEAADNETIEINENNQIALKKEIKEQIINNTKNINNIRQDINRLDGKIDKVGAHAAALAGIHYQDMRPGESQVAVGVGGYKGERATALGLAYQANNRVMVQASAAAGSGEYMANLGVSYKFGQHSVRKDTVENQDPATMTLAQAETMAMVESLKFNNQNQADEISQLKADKAAQDERIAKLEALVAQLANK